MSAKKKVSAFSVYREKRSVQDEAENGQCAAGEDVSSSNVGSDGEAGDVVMVGGGSRERVGSARKRRRARLRSMLRKRRKIDASEGMESAGSAEDGSEAVKPEKKLKKMSRKLKTASTKPAGEPAKKKIKKLSQKKENGSCEGEAVEAASPKQLEVQNLDGRNLAVPFYNQFDPDSHWDSREGGLELFRLLINPFSVDKFFEEIWERRPLFLSRHKPQYNEGWFSTDELDRILRENSLEFSVNIDVTSYQDGERCTHNPEGHAVPQMVWDFFQEGCSVRLLNPQTYSQSMWLLTATLREHFQSFVGANVYLTPAGMQGFAPHSDDIEAFVMQLEGKKRWRLYSPRETSEVLPRFSSPNLSEEELQEPILDVILEPGDLLYFPRGTFHQAESLPDVHSLHVTLSTYQKYTWGDMLAKLMSMAVERALSDNISFRQGLPLGCLNYMGTHTSHDDRRRQEFISKMEGYGQAVVQRYLLDSMDEAMDQIAAENVHSSLPPCLSRGERECTVMERGSVWRDGRMGCEAKLTSETEIKLVRYNAVRLIIDGEDYLLYYTQENSRVYQEKEPTAIPLTLSAAVLVEKLIASYPDYISIEDLCGTEVEMEEAIEVVYTLFSHCIVLIQHSEDGT